MQEEAANTTDMQLLRMPDVIKRVGLCKSAIFAGMKKGTFPKCIKIGPRATAWPAHEIDAWIKNCIAQYRGAK